MTDIIKAIALWQPWASLWLSPNKRHETRDWATKHRGLLLVHATKRIVKDIEGPLRGILDDEFGGHWAMDLPRGALIGTVDLLDVIPTEKLYADAGETTLDDQIDMECGDFSDGRFAWRRGSYRRFPQPIPYIGRQTIFGVPRAVVAEQIAASVEVVGA